MTSHRKASQKGARTKGSDLSPGSRKNPPKGFSVGVTKYNQKEIPFISGGEYKFSFVVGFGGYLFN